MAGAEYKYAIEDMDNWLRHLIKYDDGDLSREKLTVLAEVRTKLTEICKERGLV